MKDLENVLSKLGGSRCGLGYHFITTAMELLLKKEDGFLNLYRQVYPKVAEIHHVKTHCVERNIRTFIKGCYLKGNRSFLNEIACCKIDHQPTVKEFLDMIFNYMKR